MFVKLTFGAKKGISYKGSRGHFVAVRQDPSQLLRILPARRLQDHTTITISWDRGSPPSEENLARFCSVNQAKDLNGLLWLCANNPVYSSLHGRIIAEYFSKLIPRMFTKGHWVFCRNKRAHSLITESPRPSGFRLRGDALSSRSIEAYASWTMQRVQRRIRLSFSKGNNRQ
jgi:hypothetical protein